MPRSYFRFKACPRCKGDILVDRAIEDAEVCIQCGFRKFERVTQNSYPQSQLEKTVTVVKGHTNSQVIVE